MVICLTSKAIYGSEKTQLGTFLEITRSILETMAKYARKIEEINDLHSHGQRNSLPEGTRHIILLYHQVSYQNFQVSSVHPLTQI